MAVKEKIKIIYKDIEREIVKKDEIVTDVIDVKTQKKIVAQVEEEYQSCYQYNEAKRKTNLRRLKLYNNQRRDTSAVGDSLMFTVFNTIHAELYDDRLTVKWEGRGGKGDEDVEENLNALSEFDYDVMGKNQLDYEFNWDAEFFGRGLMLMLEFDRTKGVMAPAPEVLDAVTFIRDTRAKSVNGNGRRRKGAMRFGGYEVGATYWELKDLKGYFNLLALQKNKDTSSRLIDDARSARRDAQGLENFDMKEESLGKFNNYEHRLLNWFTTIKGQKYLVTLGNSRKTLVRLMELNSMGDLWPIVDRTLYPMAHDWDGVSIPDLTEDKQRAKAVLLNIGLASAKSDVIPSYVFDQTKIKNKNDLNFKINKFVAVDGNVRDAIAPIQKATAHQYVNLIMEILEDSAQKATAATDVRSGSVSGKQRTLGEQELAIAGGNKRFAMSAKVYGWSEQMFWRQWYMLYKKHFKENIDEKVIRIQGAMAPIWRPLKRDNIISSVDPDVRIESKVISEAKRIREQQSFGNASLLWLQDPNNNRRAIFKHSGKLQGLTKEQVDIFFPLTVDEIQAEEENVTLNENERPKISVNDDHLVHLEIHSKANQNLSSLAHMRAHKKMMITKRNRTDLFPAPTTPIATTPGQGEASKVTTRPAQDSVNA